MQQRYVKWILLVTLVVGLACSLPDSLEIQEQEISSETGSCTIDAETILQSLDEGNVDVFTPQKTSSEAMSVDSPPIQWSQEDYYQIANAFHEFVWQEPVERWKLHSLSFRLDCEDISFGPQFASFEIFKMRQFRGRDSRLERSIHIEPSHNQIRWFEFEHHELLSQWSSLDLPRIKVPTENALQIAESHGGSEIRLAAGNDCVIYGRIVAGLRDNDWLISYSGEGPKTLFQISIDEQTGEQEITDQETELLTNDNH